jgi:hypothetical protein
MATQIIWDDVDAEPQPPEPAEELVPSPTSPTMLPPSVHRAMFLATVDINELIAELNKRGMVVTARTGVYMPATVSTSPYAQTTALGGTVYTVPTTTSATTQPAYQHVAYGGLQQAALGGDMIHNLLGETIGGTHK